MDQIKADTMQRNGKDLKVKIQDPPDKQKQQRHFWRAVDAIRTMAKEEEDFLLNPGTCQIFDSVAFEQIPLEAPRRNMQKVYSNLVDVIHNFHTDMSAEAIVAAARNNGPSALPDGLRPAEALPADVKMQLVVQELGGHGRQQPGGTLVRGHLVAMGALSGGSKRHCGGM